MEFKEVRPLEQESNREQQAMLGMDEMDMHGPPGDKRLCLSNMQQQLGAHLPRGEANSLDRLHCCQECLPTN